MFTTRSVFTRLTILPLIFSACLVTAGDEPGSLSEKTWQEPAWKSMDRPLREAFGIAGPIPRGAGGPQAAKRAWQLQTAQEAGLSHYRREILWVETERTPGEYTWVDDDALADAQAHGQTLLGVIAYGNPLYSAQGAATGSHHYPPDDPDDIRPWVKALGEHYRGVVDRWEFWNEPNGGYRFWKSAPGGDAEAFAELAVAAAEEMRAANPDAVLALGGLFYHDYLVVPGAPRFLEDVLTARPELHDLYDAVSFHPYKRYPPGDPPEAAGSWDEDQDDMVDTMRAVMNRFGWHDKDIWITENGWPTGGLVDDTMQARYLVRSALLAFARGVKEFDWYTFWDLEPSRVVLAEPERYFGLVSVGEPDKPIDYLADGDNPPKAKLGWKALSTMLGELGPATEIADLSGDWREDGLRLIGLRQGESITLVGWYTGLVGEKSVTLPRLEGRSSVDAVDMLGNPIVLDEGKLTFTPTPVYVRYE